MVSLVYHDSLLRSLSEFRFLRCHLEVFSCNFELNRWRFQESFSAAHFLLCICLVLKNLAVFYVCFENVEAGHKY